MKLGISFHCYPGLDDGTEIALMKKNGFEATFLASEDERIDETAPLLKREGILIENLHAPFPTRAPTSTICGATTTAPP